MGVTTQKPITDKQLKFIQGLFIDLRMSNRAAQKAFFELRRLPDFASDLSCSQAQLVIAELVEMKDTATAMDKLDKEVDDDQPF